MSAKNSIKKEGKEKTEKEQYDYAEKIFQEYRAKGCKVLTKHEEVKTTHHIIEYICKCGENRKKRLHDFKRRGCRYCNMKKGKGDEKIEIREKDGEIWKTVTGGMISSFGNAKSAQGKELKIDEKGRFYIDGKHQYVTRLMAKTFELENYKLLEDSKYAVMHIDGNNDNNNLENLKVVPKGEIPKGSKRAEQKRIDYEIKEKSTDYKIVPEFPKHKIYSNGQIFNGSRYLKGSVSDGYVNICFTGKTIKLHRLVCYAFHPLPGRKCLNEYSNLQVNHIDGDTMNNSAKNLEWVTQSENINHAYKTGLNRKMQPVYLVYKNGSTREFNSIAEAARTTGDTEAQIRSCIKGKKPSTCKNDWVAKHPERIEEYKEKFSVFPQKGKESKKSPDEDQKESKNIEILSDTETFVESDIEQDEKMYSTKLYKFLEKNYGDSFEVKNNLYVIRGKRRIVRIFEPIDYFYTDEEIEGLTFNVPKNSVCIFPCLGTFKVCGKKIVLGEEERYDILNTFIKTIFLRVGKEKKTRVYKMFYDNEEPEFVQEF